jgi:prepilin-type N-terminal cleavage/methylation domain-containing protein
MMVQKMKKKKIGGFTLIELIVVIAILGILAVIAIPRFTGMRENANVSAVVSNLRNIQNAAEMVAVEQNVELSEVQEADIAAVLGIGDDLSAYDNAPKGATYQWLNSEAQLKDIPPVYPKEGAANRIIKYSDIKAAQTGGDGA